MMSTVSDDVTSAPATLDEPLSAESPTGVDQSQQRGAPANPPTEADEASQADRLFNPTIDRRLRHLPRLTGQSLSMVWRAAPRELSMAVVLQVLGSGALVVQLLTVRSLLGHVLLKGVPSASVLIVPASILGVASALAAAAAVARQAQQQLLGELVTRFAFGRVVDAASRMDLIAFESPTQHDRLQRALVNSSTRPVQMTAGLLTLAGSALSVAGIGVALVLMQPLLLIPALAAVVPVLIAAMLSGRSSYRFSFRQTARDRERAYLSSLLTHREASKELRAFSLSEFLRERYLRMYSERIALLRLETRQRVLRGVVGALCTGALAAGAVITLVWLVTNGRLSPGAAAAAAGAMLVLTTQLASVGAGIGQLYESSLFVRDFDEFINENAGTATAFTGTEPPPARLSTIQAKGVSFTYPAQHRPALRDVDVSITRGQVVALVGENGSGKSTLSKLLAGLYAPDSGDITWNEVSLRAMDIEAVRARISVLFQDFMKYQFTARDNIAVGDTSRFDDESAIRQAARRMGADTMLSRLPSGYDTQLGPEFFGGVDLSGGQWQRVAIARALYRDADLVILDEPTAALDPRAEADLFANMRDLFAGRTVVLTTHRFSSVRLADYIYVLSDGAVVEQGRHEDLMAVRGHYAELYDLQVAAFAV